MCARAGCCRTCQHTSCCRRTSHAQDLTRSHLNVWVPRRGALTDDNEAVASFFEAFKPFITLRVFDYAAEVKSTLWEHDPFFGDGDMVKANMPDAGAFTDVVRILLLHKYGGLWIDNDVIFYQDLSHLLNIAPQFVTRWLNLHVMYLHAGKCDSTQGRSSRRQHERTSSR